MSRKKDSSVAVQSNSLVSAQYRLSLSEQFLVLMMISKIDYKDDDFQGYGISIKELANTLQLNEKFAYKDFLLTYIRFHSEEKLDLSSLKSFK